MANVIKIKNSGTHLATPNSLVFGELALNYADGQIFYKDSSNNIVGLISDDTAYIYSSDSAPLNPNPKDLWFRTSTAQLFIRYDSHWVEIAMPDKASEIITTNIGSI